jgi:hypothetical protein
MFIAAAQGAGDSLMVFFVPLWGILPFLPLYFFGILFYYKFIIDKEQKVKTWIGVIISLVIIVFLYTLPSMVSTAHEDKKNIDVYQRYPLLAETLSDYYLSTNVPAYDEINIFEFDSATIPLPFSVVDKEVFTKDGLIVFMEGKEPIFAIFDNRVSSITQSPEMTLDFPLNRIFALSIGHKYRDMGYEKQKEYLNTVPGVNKKGVPIRDDMYSPALYHKRELTDRFYIRSKDLKIMNINFDEPGINGLLYQGSEYQFVEVYSNDLYDFTFFIFLNEENGGYLDYVLTYLFK